MKNFCPAVSVVIPLYNAEKYIGECLESLLAQTFQNFEVIVVDDCSTDNGVAIVQSYAEKFGGRLTLSRTEKNSGGGGLPRNKGLAFSRGEYVFFVDADDTITPTALEELYTLAKEYDADVVACESYYNVPEDLWYNADFRAQLKPFSYQQGDFVDKPTLISSDLAQRVEDISNIRFLWNLWSKLIRRSLILENELSFAKSTIGEEDKLFTFCLLCTAKKFVRVPNVINYYRVLENSLSHIKKEPLQHFTEYFRSWIVGFRYLDEFLSRREFFKQNPHLRYLLLDAHLNSCLYPILGVYTKVSVFDLDEILQKEFGRGDNSALAAFIYNMANIWRLQVKEQFNQFNEFAAQAQARITQLEAELKQKN